MWEHPFVPILLQIGPEVQALPDAMRKGPAPSNTNPLYRSMETSETKTLTAWQDAYVLQPMAEQQLRAIPKGGWGLHLTLTPVETMASETFRQEATEKPTTFKWFDVETGAVTPLNYSPAQGKKIDVTVTIPKYFAPFVVSSVDGAAIGDNGAGRFSFTLNGDSRDYLVIGNSTTVSIWNPDLGSNASVVMPQLYFSMGGVNYSLNWSSWASSLTNDAKNGGMVFGAYAHGWGYNIPANTVESVPEGMKTYGSAGLYEENTTIYLSWGQEVDTDGSSDCSAGYEWSETMSKCLKKGSDSDEDEEDIDWEKYAQYGLIGLIAVGIIAAIGS